MIFGKVNEVIFRTYWTANPERVAIEVIGLPEGFKEIKEELKLTHGQGGIKMGTNRETFARLYRRAKLKENAKSM